jgi:O-acetyl-ADP-ribose deacetylase (regulator of RNase III)
VRVRLAVGTVAQASADVLVRVAPARLVGRPPDDVLLAAGPEVVAALRRERRLLGRGRLSPGAVVATGAGSLGAPWLLHVAVPAYDVHEDRTYLLSRAYREVLAAADGLAAATVVMPALGATPPYWPLAAAATLGAVTLHSTPTSVREVLLLVPTAAGLEPFAEALARR